MIPQGYPLAAQHENGEWLTVIGWDAELSTPWPFVVSDHMPPRVVDPRELVHWVQPPAVTERLFERAGPDDWSFNQEPVTDGPVMWWEVDVRTGGEWVFRTKFLEANRAHEWAMQTDEPTRVRFVRIQAEDEYDDNEG